MGRSCSIHATGDENVQNFSRKYAMERDNLGHLDLSGVDWISWAQTRELEWALVDKVVKLWVP
jgi:hypothetical protein